MHENPDVFKATIIKASENTGLTPVVIEKDDYVTMILRLIEQKSLIIGNVVFKGGTSLSKCHKVIDRFSEDIDITFTEHLGNKRRKKLKYEVMKALSDELHLPIKNWEYIQSDRDLNAYFFDYTCLFVPENEQIREGVKVEIALASYSFPTDVMQISSFISDYLTVEDPELAKQYNLDPFEMKVQSLARTFIDKVYALCDYYLQGKSRRLSRHLYDLHKIYPQIIFDDNFRTLVCEVKNHRSKLSICPSAKSDVDICNLIQKYCSEDFYKTDFDIITETLINEEIEYSTVIETMLKIAQLDVW